MIVPDGGRKVKPPGIKILKGVSIMAVVSIVLFFVVILGAGCVEGRWQPSGSAA